MPERIYFDTVAFREAGKAFEKNLLATELRARIVISPITFIEVLSQLTVRRASDVLKQIHAALNWTNSQYTGLLPWPDDALFEVWHQKIPPDDGLTEKMQNAFNVCLATDSAHTLQEEAGKLKDFIDTIKKHTAELFGHLIQAARREPLEDHKFTDVWFHGIATRIGADPASKPMAEIIDKLSAYHEFEGTKLRTALENKDYNPEKHANDLLDAEQLIYLNDESLGFLTCDKGFQVRVSKSPQASRIFTATPNELSNEQRAEAIFRSIVAADRTKA